MPKGRDRFREYVDYLGNKKWKCKFCGIESQGSATRIRAHLAGIPRYGITACEKVDHKVRVEALETFNVKGSVLDISTGGTLGEGTERADLGMSQSVLPSDDVLNPNDTQNLNRPGCAPQQPSCCWSTGTGTASACPQDQVSLPPSDMPLDNLNNTQQSDPSNRRLDAAHGNENASTLQQLPTDSSASPSVDFTELAALLEIPNDQVLGNSRSSRLQEFIEFIGDRISPDAPLYSTEWSNLQRSQPENLPESRDVIVNTSEEIQTNELHNPTVGTLQIDSSLDVDSVNCLQDCGQLCVEEVVPVRSNTSPTDIVQYTGQLPPRCDKEDGNDTRQFSSRTSMEIDPSTASQHTSVVDLPVPEAATNAIGPSSSHASVPTQHQSVPHPSINHKTAHHNPTVPSSSWKNNLVTRQSQALMNIDPCMPSSSQAPNNAPPPPQHLPSGAGLIGPLPLPGSNMNEGVPMMSYPNTSNNFEENIALKRKLGPLCSKEASLRNELEFAASLSLKKPRMEVVNWLVNVEKLRNDYTEAASEDCLPPHQQVDILMHEAEDLMRQSKGLFEARGTKFNKFLEDKMVGEAFWRNTTKILEYLVGNQISRLGIYGMGGVGKTTIMMHIHNRLLEEANYGNVLWITVSQDFNIQRLQDVISNELDLGELREKDVKKRAAILWDCLTERSKSTIILDDVWAHFDLKEVGIPVKADGIKLVLTTRSFEVCRQMHCQEMIKIEPLSHTEADSLFMEELGSEVAPNLESRVFVKSIVEECAGLPLAVITMARSMQGVTDVFEWKDCLEKLRESDMGQTDMEKVLKKLEFSYNRLSNHEVQQCFLSCALYPEDELIDKFELIELFIDQGLIGQLHTREKHYDRGLTILNKLENVCLLEDHGSAMKMHDLIRDMALQIMRAASIVKAGKGLRRIPSNDYWTEALEKVSLMQNEIGEFPLNMSPNCPKLSIFLLNANYLNVVAIPDAFAKQLRGLKVLNLSGCNLRELPNSISDLVNLRALVLRYCRGLCCIPHLGKLRYLRKLDIYECASLEAIRGLEMLMDLRYLDLRGTHIERLPKGTLGALLNLQYLKVEAVNEEVTKLWALETLECSFEDVDDFNKFVRVLSEQRNNPHYYKLKVHEEASEIYVQISDDARFRNYDRSVHIQTWSYAIVSVGGESSGNCILIPQNVQSLAMSNCIGMTKLSDVGPLENLEKLDIYQWRELRVLCGGQDEEIIDIRDSPAPAPTPLIFPSLRVLKISGCPILKYLFRHGPNFSLPHLQKIDISCCYDMVGITVADTSPPLHPSPAFPSLKYISVTSCDQIERVVESGGLPHFPNLREIRVRNCGNMEEIIGRPPPYMPIEEILLELLSVEICHNMRKLFPHELLIHLRNLQNIHVSGCIGMVEMISRAGQGQEGSMMTPVNNTLSSFQSSISLPKVNSFHPHYLPQLKSICEVPKIGYSSKHLKVLCRGQDEEIIDVHDSLAPTPTPPLSASLGKLNFLKIEDLPLAPTPTRPFSPSLRMLNISNCPKLKYLFGHEPKFFLPHLREIAVYQCGEMVGITSPPLQPLLSPLLQPPPAFPSLEVITVQKCDKMKRAVESEWLPHFPNLRTIGVHRCENMEEIIGGPPPYVSVEEISLEWLWVKECHNMKKLFLHEWILHLRNLRIIDVACCRRMVEMISGVGQGQEGSVMTLVNNTPSSSQSSISLPKLNCLFLRKLPQLKSICEVPITCDSMEGLVVFLCPELNRIPLQLRLRDIEDLPRIEVEGEEKWKTLIWDHPNAQTLLQSHLLCNGISCILEGQRISKSSAKWMRTPPMLISEESYEWPSLLFFQNFEYRHWGPSRAWTHPDGHGWT